MIKIKCCVMRTCPNRQVIHSTDCNVKSFRFPPDGERKDKWMTFINKYNRTVVTYKKWTKERLCSEHFAPDVISSTGLSLNKDAVPTIAPPLFTAAVAHEYGLIPNEGSSLIDIVNDFEKSREQFLAAVEDDPLSLKATEMLADIPSDTEDPCPNRSLNFTEAEIIRMPVEIDESMQPVPDDDDDDDADTMIDDSTESLSGVSDYSEMSVISEADENVDPSGKTQADPAKASFDSTTANYDGNSPLKSRQKRSYGQLDEEDFISPRRRKVAWQIVTERHTILHRKIRSLQGKLQRAVAKVQSLQGMLNHLQNDRYISAEVSRIIQDTFEGAPKAVLDRILHSGKTDPFDKTLMQFALTLNYHSPAAYKYVREMFMDALPHPRTIRKLYEAIECEPGFNEEAFKAVKTMVEEAKKEGKQLLCALMCDEMSIRKQAQETSQGVVGFTTVGRTTFVDNAPLAKDAWVMMLVAINGSWKLPVGYFFINSLNGEQRGNILKECLNYLSDTGVTIPSVTFDGNSVNMTMVEVLGANLKVTSPKYQPWFKHPATGEKVHVVLDAAHMVKLWRNCLGNRNVKLFDSQNREIKWDYLVKLHNQQDREGLLYGTRVRRSHIAFQENKQKVRLATQLLSLSSADALKTLREQGYSDYYGSEATEDFIRNADMIFDILNSKNLNARKNQNMPFTKENYSLLSKLCSDGRNYILGLKVQGFNSERGEWCDPVPLIESIWKTGFLGFVTGIDTALSMFDIYVRTGILDFIPMYKLSQDHLETFFCAVRSHLGWNNNPNVQQFKAAYKKLLIQVQLGGKHNANCWPLDSTRILNISTTAKNRRINPNDVTDDFDDDELLAEDDKLIANHDPQAPVPSLYPLTEFVTDAVEYIAGFVSMSLSESCRCIICESALFGTTTNSNLLKNKTKGGLMFPSQDVVSICKFTEQIIRANAHKKIHLRRALPGYINSIKRRVTNSIFPTLDADHDFAVVDIESHRSLLISSIIKKYLVLRICHDVKRLNETVIRRNIRQTLTKLVLFQGQ